MADFCWDCVHEKLGVDAELNDLKGLCKDDEVIIVLCEGCGEMLADSKGKRVDGPYGVKGPRGPEAES